MLLRTCDTVRMASILDREMRPALRMAASVSIATSLYAISFGALAVTAGFTTLQAMALSLLLFTGGSQFAIVGVVSGAGFTPGATVSAVATSTVLALRHSVYGLELAPQLDVHGARRLAAALFTIDETAGVALAQPTLRARRVGFWATGLMLYTGWGLMTWIGAVAGAAIADPAAWGLDAAAGAAFLGLLWPRLRGREPTAIAVVAAGTAILLTPLLDAGLPVLAAALAGLACTFVLRAHRGRRPSGEPRDDGHCEGERG